MNHALAGISLVVGLGFVATPVMAQSQLDRGSAALQGLQERSIRLTPSTPNAGGLGLTAANSPIPNSDPDSEVVLQELTPETQLIFRPINNNTQGGPAASGAGLTGNNQIQVIYQPQ